MKILIDYYNDINKPILSDSTLKGFLIGFSVTIINAALNVSNMKSFAANVVPSIKVGAFWATATFVHGVAGPLFNKLFRKLNIRDNVFSESLRGAFAITTTALAASKFGYAVRAPLQNYLILFVVNTLVQGIVYHPTETRVIAPSL